jgi:hydrogenase nickel incorporation protein HypA/HybF
MHELSLMRNLVAIVCDAAQGRRVHKVWLEIGERSALVPDAMRFCFDIVAKGTALETAALEIVEVVAGWRCRDCDARLGDAAQATCPHCGSARVAQCTGHELNISAMEVETCA